MATKPDQSQYTVIIQWSDEDQRYVVSLPEWGPHLKSHGATCEEAARNAREVPELLMEPENPPVVHPAPELFQYPGADIRNLPLDSVGAGAAAKRSPAKQTA
jgi:antitoxin HicB